MPRRLHLLGSSPIRRGKIGSAIALIERALPQLQDLPEAHLNLGNALREAGMLTEAVDQLSAGDRAGTRLRHGAQQSRPRAE